MLKPMSDPQVPKYVRTENHRRSWALTVAMLILTINFTIEAARDLSASSAGVWFHLPAAVLTAVFFVQNLRNAEWLRRHPESRSG